MMPVLWLLTEHRDALGWIKFEVTCIDNPLVSVGNTRCNAGNHLIDLNSISS
jgi:hypothetical protein